MKWSTIYSALLLVAVAATAVYSSATTQQYGTAEGRHVYACNMICMGIITHVG